MKKILILAANPRQDLDLRREVHILKSVIERSQFQDKFQIKISFGISSDEIQRLFLEHQPRIVHFCGHGAGEQGLVFENDENSEKLVSNEALSDLFKIFTNQVECVLLNACYSDIQATEISHHINYVIGMKQAIRDDAAIVFTRGFYQALAYGESIDNSYNLGCNAIKIQSDDSYDYSSVTSEVERKFINRKLVSQSLPEYLKPQLKIKSPLTPFSNVKVSNLSEDSLDLIELVQDEISRNQYREHIEDDFQLGRNNLNQRQSLTRQEYRWRKVLLSKLKEGWIKGVSKNSLFKQVLFEQTITNRPDAIQKHPFSQLEELSVESDKSFEFIQASDIFEGMGAGRTLLILGEPGTGKTLSMLKLAERLIKRTEQDLSLPIPVVFNLSSWAIKRQNIADWLVEELKDKYQVSKALGKQWIEQGDLILLLDGLDEVKAEYRNDCVNALNQFLDEHGTTEMVVSCRVQDYEALSERLKLRSAICIQPLSSEYINWYLEDVGKPLVGLKELIQMDKELEEFAKTPLIFSVMSITYQGYSSENILLQLNSIDNRYKNLFDSYIEKMFGRKLNNQINNQKYSNKETIRQLVWISKIMNKEFQSLFLIEKIQPSYLNLGEGSLNTIKWIYYILVMLIVYLIVSLLFVPTIFDIGLKEEFGLLKTLILMPISLVCCGLFSSLTSILIYRYLKTRIRTFITKVLRSNLDIFNKNRSVTKFLISALINGTISSLITSSFYGILIDFFAKDRPWVGNSLFIYPLFSTILALILEVVHSEIFKIKPVQNLEFSLEKTKINVFFIISFGLLFPVFYQIRNFIIWQSLDWESLGKLMLALISIGICFIVFNGFEIPTNIKEESTKPNQGILDSRKNTLFYMRIVIPVGGIIALIWATQTKFTEQYIAVMYGIVLALIGSILIFGQSSGMACIKHFVLRVILYFTEHIPWNYSRFLDYATERIFMQKVGGGYIFIHRMLMEHFAQMKGYL